VYQLHSPSLEDLQRYDWFGGMARLKEQGKIRLIGVSINDAASGRWLIEQGLSEVLQVAYSILQPEVGEEVFPLAERHGVGILVRMPMARGILTGKFRPGQEVGPDHRARLQGALLSQQIEQAEHYRSLTEGKEVTMGQMALRYSISPPAVSAAIPGARTLEQLEQNVAASNGVGLSPDELAEIARIQQDEGQ
jgi:aryl-alcohol dehydrogenase-like predicted oxidoreductase